MATGQELAIQSKHISVPKELGLQSFPLPVGRRLHEIVAEILALEPRQKLGPLAQQLSDEIKAWYLHAKDVIRGKDKTVTGSLKHSIKLWREHLSCLSAEHRDRILRRIHSGVPLPWLTGAPPTRPLRTFHNSDDLCQKKDKVWDTLKEHADFSLTHWTEQFLQPSLLLLRFALWP